MLKSACCVRYTEVHDAVRYKCHFILYSVHRDVAMQSLSHSMTSRCDICLVMHLLIDACLGVTFLHYHSYDDWPLPFLCVLPVLEMFILYSYFISFRVHWLMPFCRAIYCDIDRRCIRGNPRCSDDTCSALRLSRHSYATVLVQSFWWYRDDTFCLVRHCRSAAHSTAGVPSWRAARCVNLFYSVAFLFCMKNMLFFLVILARYYHSIHWSIDSSVSVLMRCVICWSYSFWWSMKEVIVYQIFFVFSDPSISLNTVLYGWPLFSDSGTDLCCMSSVVCDITVQVVLQARTPPQHVTLAQTQMPQNDRAAAAESLYSCRKQKSGLS